VVIAAVTDTTDERHTWRHHWRAGASVALHRTDAGAWHRTDAVHSEPHSLWATVDAHARRRSRTVVWAHDLGYHIRVTDAMRQLDALGWTYVAGNDVVRSGWQKWTAGDRTLFLVDMQSVFPHRVAALRAALAGLETGTGPVHPTQTPPAPPAAAYAATLAEVVLWYLAWLETEDLGVWQPTGAGQSWAAWRHRFMPYPPTTHADAKVLAAERRAMWTGRAEAWVHGRDESAPVWEWDMQAAYCRIAASTSLPVRLIGEVDDPGRAVLGQRPGNRNYLALCVLHTTVPLVPAEVGEHIAWPVGHFRTVLWDNEVRLARGYGATVEIERAWQYVSVPALKGWGEWVLSKITAPGGDIPELERMVLKHWSRALIGRLALRYRKWEPFGSSTDTDWRRVDGVDHESGERFDLLWMGRTLQRAAGTAEAPDSLPMMTGYVMAECRVRLWWVIMAAGPENVLYVDTDSVVVNGAGNRALAASVALRDATGLRVKSRHRGYDIRGPRQLWLGGMPKLSGVPTDAVRTGPDTAWGSVTESLPVALSAGRVDEVVISAREWTVKGTDRRRTHLPGGRTTPLELSGGAGNVPVSA